MNSQKHLGTTITNAGDRKLEKKEIFFMTNANMKLLKSKTYTQCIAETISKIQKDEDDLRIL